jgi:hypothetical protein
VTAGARTGVALGLVACLLAPVTARAGGPLVVATDGTPVGWDPSAPVTYLTDRGGLGKLDHDEAVATVEALFDVWTAIPTATIAFERAGDLGVDVGPGNFAQFLGPFAGVTTPIGHSVIVFDRGGEIFDTLFGVGTGVLGFADPTFMSDGISTVPIGAPVPPGAKIIEGSPS